MAEFQRNKDRNRHREKRNMKEKKGVYITPADGGVVNVMEKKAFYVIIGASDVVGAVKKEGFQFKKKGLKFYAYRDDERAASYVIDPKTGLSVWKGRLEDDIQSCFSKKRAKQVRKLRKSSDYASKVKAFKAMKKARRDYDHSL